jgi:hypoxanthine phosphoribosyltransferase
MWSDGKTLLLSEEQIRRRVAEMGRQISEDYAGRAVTVIGILKGSFIFVADLVRQIVPEIPLEVDFISVSSYGASTTSSGTVHITRDIEIDIADKDVILIEDIVDTGLTLTHVHKVLSQRKPRSVRIATLLEKPASRKYEGTVHYVGFQIPSRFVIGYGLDHSQNHRNLPEIHSLDEI